MLKIPRLDAIVYRTGGNSPCYVSEHDCSFARDKDFYGSLSGLKSQVCADISSGVYPPGQFNFLRPFVTCVDAVLPLRDGELKQSFLGCSYEASDVKGRKGFISMCPTNYLSNEGDDLLGSLTSLGEIIEARYLDECVHDLMRELPRAPLITTFGLDDGDVRPPEVGAIIQRNKGSFEAFSPGLPFSSKACDPYEALQGLESALSEQPESANGHLLHADPIFGPMDVQLCLEDSFFMKRFLISISPCKNGTRYYRAYAPQADVSARSYSIEGAIQSIKEAVISKYQGASSTEIQAALTSRPILTTARLN